MSEFWIGNVSLLLTMLCGTASQIVLKALFNETGPLQWSLRQIPKHPGAIARIALASVLLGAAFIFWMMTLSRLELSYAYAVACSSALLVAFFSVFFLGETVTAKMWLGIVLIVLGTALVVPSR